MDFSNVKHTSIGTTNSRPALKTIIVRLQLHCLPLWQLLILGISFHRSPYTFLDFMNTIRISIDEYIPWICLRRLSFETPSMFMFWKCNYLTNKCVYFDFLLIDDNVLCTGRLHKYVWYLSRANQPEGSHFVISFFIRSHRIRNVKCCRLLFKFLNSNGTFQQNEWFQENWIFNEFDIFCWRNLFQRDKIGNLMRWHYEWKLVEQHTAMKVITTKATECTGASNVHRWNHCELLDGASWYLSNLDFEFVTTTNFEWNISLIYEFWSNEIVVTQFCQNQISLNFGHENESISCSFDNHSGTTSTKNVLRIFVVLIFDRYFSQRHFTKIHDFFQILLNRCKKMMFLN